MRLLKQWCPRDSWCSSALRDKLREGRLVLRVTCKVVVDVEDAASVAEFWGLDEYQRVFPDRPHVLQPLRSRGDGAL
jgi:hypothetical protein